MGRNQTNVTPVPQEVNEAVEEELQEEWMAQLTTFMQDRLVAAPRPSGASSAADVRHAFFEFCPEVPKKEVGLRLARKGFQEDSVHYNDGIKRTKKRVYRARMDGETQLVALRMSSTGGA